MTVNLIDRFLILKKVQKSEFQLLGITALFISAKYVDIYPPEIDEFCYVCAGAYFKSDVVRMEAEILDAVKFDLVYVSQYEMFSLYSDQCKFSSF